MDKKNIKIALEVIDTWKRYISFAQITEMKSIEDILHGLNALNGVGLILPDNKPELDRLGRPRSKVPHQCYGHPEPTGMWCWIARFLKFEWPNYMREATGRDIKYDDNAGCAALVKFLNDFDIGNEQAYKYYTMSGALLPLDEERDKERRDRIREEIDLFDFLNLTESDFYLFRDGCIRVNNAMPNFDCFQQSNMDDLRYLIAEYPEKSNGEKHWSLDNDQRNAA